MDPEIIETEDEIEEAPAPRTIMPPVTNRFLFVDIAALRAKQLRRGALPRLSEVEDPAPRVHRDPPFKPERVAMEEVRRGLVEYEVPAAKKAEEAEAKAKAKAKNE
jgi:DNA-directed RNA polymerase subunit K/omega